MQLVQSHCYLPQTRSDVSWLACGYCYFTFKMRCVLWWVIYGTPLCHYSIVDVLPMQIVILFERQFNLSMEILQSFSHHSTGKSLSANPCYPIFIQGIQTQGSVVPLDDTVTCASRADAFGMNCDANRLLFPGIIRQPPPTRFPQLFEMHSMIERKTETGEH